MKLPWKRGPTVDAQRWVVVDVESSGLDTRRDRLLAIAAVALRPGPDGPRIRVGDSFEQVLRQDGAPIDRANILLHGIGAGEQAAGAPPAEALAAFERWRGHAPLIAFHSAFDEAMLGRAMRAALGRPLDAAWLDLAALAPVVAPGVAARSLDEWLDHAGIACVQRHQAAADTHATARLLLWLWPAVRAQGAGSDFAALQGLARQARWLPR